MSDSLRLASPRQSCQPISSMFMIEEVRYVIGDSGARAVVASSDKGAPVLDLIGTANLSSVVLWGEGMPVDDVAMSAGTVGYELLCALAQRVHVSEVG